DTTDLEAVTVYARRLVPISRVAAAVSVIPQETIERTLSADVKELVRYEPGLSVRSDPFRFGVDTFAVRGVGGNRVSVEVDGIPAAGGFAIGAYADSGRSFVDLAFVERVEVLRGPASSLYGRDAIGGVVAMTTLRPGSLLDAAADTSARVESGYASKDDGWHASLIGAARLGRADVLLGYVRRAGQESGTAADVTPNPRDYAADSLLGRIEFADAPGGPFTLTAESGRIRQDTSVDALLGTPPRFVSTTLLLGDDRNERFRVDIGQRLDRTAWFDSAEWRLYWQGTDTEQRSFERRRAVPPRTPPLQIERQFRVEDRAYGLEFTAACAVTAGLTHNFVYGLEASLTTLDELRDGLQVNLTTGATTTTILGETMPMRDFPLTDVTEIGIFLQDEMQGRNSAWTLIPALRMDYYRLASKADRIYREDNPAVAVVGLDELSFAPKLGVTYSIGPHATAFVQYAHGFRSPPPEDVNIGFELPLLNYRAIPNPDLQPERSHGYEMGLRWHGDALQLTASGFYNDYDDFIESRVNLGPDPATGVVQFQSQNIDKARIYGVEMAATVRGGKLTQGLEGWTGRLVASWARGDDLARNVPLNSVDPASVMAEVGYAPASAAWSAQLVLTAVEARRDVDDTLLDLYQTHGYVTLDLLTQVDLGRGMRLNAGLFNLTDVDYIEWADVRGRPAGDPLIPYYTRPGRNASISLRWQF
ncbi:MAG: TonB-dependent hemoglobin/transferrin/lactoferrin family receptor, partial [Burkholderiaceae bacterium]|nr:TonB-dependent hemoglobin/transferrin/lactoferrin family receptor [Burkholderiaceae bacterium]